MKRLFLLSLAAVMLAGCGTGETPNMAAEGTPTALAAGTIEAEKTTDEAPQAEIEPETIIPVVLPIDEYVERRTFKAFGEYIKDRFLGYHVGDDIEFVTDEADVPVYAIADGTVVEINELVSGYGGFILTRHELDGKTVNAIYGHLDVKQVPVKKGDAVKKGQVIAYLGEGESKETDGRRKHLHFGLYEGDEVRFKGYELEETAVSTWINPQNFFENYGLIGKGGATALASARGGERDFKTADEPGEEFANLRFRVPEGMEVEYVPAIQSLNLYTVSGDGTARDRSQIFIRFFDASQFLTLSTVTVHLTSDLTVGTGDYRARRYDIEKKPGVADFPEQPDWRNERHIVTDTRKADGQTRYFVVAQNPELDTRIYEAFLESIEIR
jgi:hypothetical protein